MIFMSKLKVFLERKVLRYQICNQRSYIDGTDNAIVKV